MRMRILLALLLAGQVYPQDAVFKVDTKLVIVNVTVRDKSGNPVTNLKKEDFEVLEDNVRQSLSVFDIETLDNGVLPALAADTPAPTLVERNATPAAAAAPVAARNPEVRHDDKRLLALFFDSSSLQPVDQVRARDAAIDFIRRQMTSADLVTIFRYGNKLEVLQDFTADRTLLLETIRKMALGEGSELAGEASSDAGDDGFAADDSEFNLFNTDRKLSALEDVARKLSVYPEKKALVYFSSGLNATGMENQSQLKATVNAAVRANVAFYPVDARGLTAAAPAGDASQASPRGTNVLNGSQQRGQRQSFTNSQDTLVSLAADTGGKALVDSNDLSMGIRQAQQDIRSYYIIGYYSTNGAEDGKYRRIQIRLADKTLAGQSKLEFRNGYFASKTFRNFTSTDKERQLEEALALGDPVSELPLALEVDYFRVAKDRYFVTLSVKIPGSVIELARKGGQQSTQFDFLGEVRDGNGRPAGGVRDNITVKLNESDAAKLGQRHLQYDAGITLAPGDYSLRFLARENQSGKMGTFETRFNVPDLNNVHSLRVSSVIWSSQKEPVTAAVGSASNDKKSLATHPLAQNGQKLVPSITRVFRRDQTVFVYFEVYDPEQDPGNKSTSVSAQIELFAAGRRVFASPPAHVTALGTTRPGVAPFQFQLAAGQIPAGQFTAQVNVVDETGRKFAFPRSSVVVLP